MGCGALVEHVKDLLHDLLPHGCKPAAHNAKELVVADATGAVTVKVPVQKLHLRLGQSQVVESAALRELLDVQLATLINIANLNGQTDNARANGAQFHVARRSFIHTRVALALKWRPRPRIPSAPRRLREARSFVMTASTSGGVSSPIFAHGSPRPSARCEVVQAALHPATRFKKQPRVAHTQSAQRQSNLLPYLVTFEFFPRPCDMHATSCEMRCATVSSSPLLPDRHHCIARGCLGSVAHAHSHLARHAAAVPCAPVETAVRTGRSRDSSLHRLSCPPPAVAQPPLLRPTR